MNQIQKIEQFRKDLALAETYEDIKALDAKAAAVAEFARRNKISKQKQDELGEFRIEIEAKKGAWLDEFYPKGGDMTSAKANSNSSSLLDVGITYDESSNARLIKNETDIVQDVVQQLKEDDKKVVTPYAVQREVRNRKKELEKQRRAEERNKAVEVIKDDSGNEIKDIDAGWHKIGNQFLYYGNNTDEDFLNFVPRCKLAFADPPYNAGVDDWDNDFTWGQDYLQDIADVVAVTPGGWNSYNFYHTTNMIYQWEMACWIKNGMTHGRCGFANWIKVSIFAREKPKIKQDFFHITIKTSETDDTYHKGRKPYPFMAYLIDMFTIKNEKIIDPFAGSGTTLLMSEKMQRVSYNAEIDKTYCMKIINRAISNGMKYEKI